MSRLAGGRVWLAGASQIDGEIEELAARLEYADDIPELAVELCRFELLVVHVLEFEAVASELPQQRVMLRE